MDTKTEELLKTLKAAQKTGTTIDWTQIIITALPLLIQFVEQLLGEQKAQTQKLSDIAYDVRKHVKTERQLHGLKD